MTTVTTVTTLFQEGPYEGQMIPLRFSNGVPSEVRIQVGIEEDEHGKVAMDVYRLVGVEEAPHPMRGLVAFAVFQAKIRALPGTAYGAE